MYSKQTIIINKTGLHARPAATFCSEAKKFSSKVMIKNLDLNNNCVNAKSIIMVLSQELNKGTNVEISAEGEDEEVAVNSLIELIETGFGEE